MDIDGARVEFQAGHDVGAVHVGQHPVEQIQVIAPFGQRAHALAPRTEPGNVVAGLFQLFDDGRGTSSRKAIFMAGDAWRENPKFIVVSPIRDCAWKRRGNPVLNLPASP